MKFIPRKTILGFAAVLVGLLLTASCLGTIMAAQEGKVTPRDPATGIILGSEPRTLGPADSERAVLFVHGHLGSTNNFADLPDRLAAEGWTVRVMLLPGHGTSPLDYETVTREEMINAVCGELRELKKTHSHVALVGHSMGATLSTIAASREGADELVLAAPYFGVTNHWYYVLAPETWSHALTGPFRYLYKGDFFKQIKRKEAKPEIFSYTWAPTTSLTMMQTLASEARSPEILEKIHCPVLWIHSPNDVASSYKAANRCIDQMKSANIERITLQNSNHLIFHDYDRDLVKSSIMNSLQKEFR